jgi:hypothetical protein
MNAEELKHPLVLQLLIQARRKAHLQLRELLLDATGNDRVDEIDAFCRRLESSLSKNSTQRSIKTWYQRLIGPAPHDLLSMEHLERILDVLRHPGHPKRELWRDCDEVRSDVLDYLNRNNSYAPEFAFIAVNVVFPQDPGTGPGIVKGPQKVTEDQIKQEEEKTVEWGIRDWSRPPVAAGCHAWVPGVRSWEVMSRVQAFSLAGQPGHRDLKNVHICGEAFSDYQGFIEGALRTARSVARIIAPMHINE